MAQKNDTSKMVKCIYRHLFYEYEYFRTKKNPHDSVFLLWGIFILRIYKFLRTFSFSSSFFFLKYGTLHEFACHPCAGAMLIFSISFQF